MTQTPSCRRSRDLDKSNKFRQMQELTNDYYSEIKLHNIFHIRPLNLVLIKKNQQLHSRSQYWNDNEAAPANGGFVHKANTVTPATRSTSISESTGASMEITKMPNLRNGSKGGIRTRAHLIASPAFYHRATALHSSLCDNSRFIY